MHEYWCFSIKNIREKLQEHLVKLKKKDQRINDIKAIVLIFFDQDKLECCPCSQVTYTKILKGKVANIQIFNSKVQGSRYTHTENKYDKILITVESGQKEHIC